MVYRLVEAVLHYGEVRKAVNILWVCHNNHWRHVDVRKCSFFFKATHLPADVQVGRLPWSIAVLEVPRPKGILRSYCVRPCEANKWSRALVVNASTLPAGVLEFMVRVACYSDNLVYRLNTHTDALHVRRSSLFDSSNVRTHFNEKLFFVIFRQYCVRSI